MKNLFITLGLLLISVIAFGQNGTLRGTIFEEETGEAVPFAAVYVVELQSGTTSDLDGAYALDLPEGSYTIQFSFIGLQETTVSEVHIKANEVNVLEVQMQPESQMIEEIIVTATQLRNTEAALATIKRKSSNVVDGISSQTFKKIGDSNAGDAIKRVTGVSVEGGKHVYVRGLGDRYTKTIVNGLDIPGLDPDRNSFEMDLFPTNIIDNILVYKSFSPDLPGDFTGGLIDIVTIDFPDQKVVEISAGASYNPNMHFNPDFLTYEGSSTDWLGFDSGARDLPFDVRTEIPNPASNDPATLEATSRMSETMAAVRSQNSMNSSFGASIGNQFDWGGKTIGYVASLSYKNKTSFYDDAQFNTYIFDNQNFPGEFKLINDKKVVGDIGQNDILWNAMFGTSLKTKYNKVSINYLRLQNGTSSAVQQTIEKSQSSSALLVKDVLEYTQRSVNNINIQGKHVIPDSKFEIEWRTSPTFIKVDEPDLRSTAFEKLGEDNFQLAPSVGADASRTWRHLEESSYNGKVDVTYNLSGDDQKTSKIKFGFLGSLKERDFSINNYLVRVLSQTSLDFNGNPDNLFLDENLWTPNSNTGTYIRGQFEAANTFNASQSILAGYGMHEFVLNEKIKIIYGARLEQAKNWYTGVANDGMESINDSLVLDELNLLPSANIIYSINDRMNLRVSFNKTVARPTFKEKSIAQIQDRITGRTFIGNLDLLQTEVDNYDIRWEHFGERGQLISVSGFYKMFTNPIELVPYSDSAPDNFTPRNLEGGAKAYGVEFEFLKNLGFISPTLEALTVGANITLIKSEAKRNTLRTDEETTRTMFGQSPYILNTIIGYNNKEAGIEFNASYNVQGKRLVVVGAGSFSDVYENPFHSVNIKASKKFGPTKNIKLSLSVDNLLNQRRQKQYEAYSGDTGIFELRNIGRSISIGISTYF
ncbi:MAG: TonB-dependent receptor [Saprospiraceae bacterium]|nr:TonB-dependent receptor [Saprospiraceae bacterium]